MIGDDKNIKNTHSVVMSSSLGGMTGVGPVTATVLPPGVCLPFAAWLALPPPPFFAAAFCKLIIKYYDYKMDLSRKHEQTYCLRVKCYPKRSYFFFLVGYVPDLFKI